MSEPNLARAIVEQARARPLLGDGLRPGQRVALVAPTSTDYVITWLACLLAGTPVALVNPTYPAELADRMLAPLAPDLVLDLGPPDLVLAPLPLFHINPMGYGIITSLLTGADALTVRRFSASGLWPA